MSKSMSVDWTTEYIIIFSLGRQNMYLPKGIYYWSSRLLCDWDTQVTEESIHLFRQ